MEAVQDGLAPFVGAAATHTAAAAPAQLNPEQQAAAFAPLDQALVVLAAAGTGKTTTMRDRVRFMLQQGVEPEACLVLTFSRKAQAEFEQRLQAVVGAQGVTVSTFHGWAWGLVRRHWQQAGFAERPTVLASEEQHLALMRDCLIWDRLAELQACMRSWLFLPPSATWVEIADTAAERHAALYTACLRAALEAHNTAEQPGSWAALAPEAAAARPFLQLPPRLQMLLLLELHTALRRRFGGSSSSSGRSRSAEDDCCAHELLSSADAQAPFFLSWLEAEKRQGRLPDMEAYAAFCAGAGAGMQSSAPSSSSSSAPADRRKCLQRVAAAYQAELQRLCLVTLGDMPLLARRLLEDDSGEARQWARDRWRHVLVDEFQDTGRCMLDLLKLLLGERRSVTVVGDDDQTIYSFLSAVPRIFSEFQAHFEARMLCLQTNFRSTAAICSFGTALLHDNRGRAADKRMIPARGGSALCPPVVVRQFGSASEEAEALAAEVHRLWRQEGLPLSSICALYRCLRLQGAAPHAPLMAALRRRGIPFVVVGNQRLAEDEGVAALISYLALVANPACDPAFEAVLGLPYHGLGQDVRGAVAQQRQAARLEGRAPPSLLECAEQVCSTAEASSAVAAADPFSQLSGSQLAQVVSQLNREDLSELRRLVHLLRRLQQVVGWEPLPQAVRRVLHESGLVAWLQQQQGQQQVCAAMEGSSSSSCAAEGQRIGSEEGEGEEEGLPPQLRTVLAKAQQLAAEWQGTQGGMQVGPQKAAGAGNAGSVGSLDWEVEEAPSDQQHAQQQTPHGVELVKELLVRLATDTSADTTVWKPGCMPQQQGRQQGQQQGQAPSEEEEDPRCLTISTIHAAKGLEWPVVLLPSACDGHLPVQFRPSAAALAAWQAGSGGGEGEEEEQAGFSFRDCQRAHYEEERRLFHVAATRAKDRLLISYVQPRPQHAVAEEGVEDVPDEVSTHPTKQSAPDERPTDPSQLPRCSSILAGTLRRLRSGAQQQQQQQQGLLCFEGRLPDEDFPGLWAPLAAEPAHAPRAAVTAPPPYAAPGSQNVLSASGGNSQSSQPRPLSLAEQCRQRLAAGKGKGSAGPGGLKSAGVAKRRLGIGRGGRTGQSGGGGSTPLATQLN